MFLSFYYKCSTRKDWIIIQHLVRCSFMWKLRVLGGRSMNGIMFYCKSDWHFAFAIPLGFFMFFAPPPCTNSACLPSALASWVSLLTVRKAFRHKKGNRKISLLHNSHNSYCHHWFGDIPFVFCCVFSACTSIQLNYNKKERQRKIPNETENNKRAPGRLSNIMTSESERKKNTKLE